MTLAGILLAWVAVRRAPGEAERAEASARAAFGVKIALLATALQLVVGLWLTISVPRDVLLGLMRGGAATMAPFTLGIFAGFGLLVFLARVRDPIADRSLRSARSLELFGLAMLLMLVTRHQLRDLYIAAAGAHATPATTGQWGVFAIFLVSFVVCVGLSIVALVRSAKDRPGPGEPRRPEGSRPLGTARSPDALGPRWGYDGGVLGGPSQPTLRDLWTPEDDEDVRLFLEAASRGDLLAALSAIEGASAADRLEDEAQVTAWAAVAARRLTLLPSPRAVRALAPPARSPRRRARLPGRRRRLLGDPELLPPPGPRAEEGDADPPLLRLDRGRPERPGSPSTASGCRATSSPASAGRRASTSTRSREARSSRARGAALSTTGSPDRRRRWSDEFLAASPTDQILERVLNNLAATTREERDAAGSYRVATFLAALRPLSPERTLQKAMTAAAIGVTEEAATAFADVIERFPDSPEAERASQGLDSLATGTPVN